MVKHLLIFRYISSKNCLINVEDQRGKVKLKVHPHAHTSAINRIKHGTQFVDTWYNMNLRLSKMLSRNSLNRLCVYNKYKIEYQNC